MNVAGDGSNGGHPGQHGPGNGATKRCRVCGKDVTHAPRVRDRAGRYRCPRCLPPAERDALGLPEKAHPAATFDPALAETKADLPAIDDRPLPRARPASQDSGDTRADTPAFSQDDALALAPERPDAAAARATPGPRARIDWGAADDTTNEPEPLAAAVTPEGPADLREDEIPEDRSGLLRPLRARDLKVPLAAFVVGVLAAAGIAFGVTAEPGRDAEAVRAAMVSGGSAVVQAVAGCAVYLLCQTIWLRPGLRWEIACARVAAVSALLAAGAIAAAFVPVIGGVLVWALPLVVIAVALRKYVLLRPADALYVGVLMYAVQLGVRVALDADLWVKPPDPAADLLPAARP